MYKLHLFGQILDHKLGVWLIYETISFYFLLEDTNSMVWGLLKLLKVFFPCLTHWHFKRPRMPPFNKLNRLVLDRVKYVKSHPQGSRGEWRVHSFWLLNIDQQNKGCSLSTSVAYTLVFTVVGFCTCPMDVTVLVLVLVLWPQAQFLSSFI